MAGAKLTKVLLDTNVLIDYYARRESFWRVWWKLRLAHAFGDVELWASAKSFTDVFFVLAKAVGSAELQRAFAESMAFLKLCAVDGRDVVEAAHREWPDFEACLVSIAAENVGADFILSRDAHGFERSTVPACSPQKFFTWMEAERGLSYADFRYNGTTWEEVAE